MNPFKSKSPIIQFGTVVFATFGVGVILILFTNLSCDSRYERYDKNLVQLRSVIAAIDQYHARRMTYPNTLDELVPTHLSAMPKLRGRMNWYYHVGDDFYDVGFEGGFYEVIGGYTSKRNHFYADDQ